MDNLNPKIGEKIDRSKVVSVERERAGPVMVINNPPDRPTDPIAVAMIYRYWPIITGLTESFRKLICVSREGRFSSRRWSLWCIYCSVTSAISLHPNHADSRFPRLIGFLPANRHLEEEQQLVRFR